MAHEKEQTDLSFNTQEGLDHESESGLDRGSDERDEVHEAVVGSLVALLAQEALGLALTGALGGVDRPARPVRLLAEAAGAVAPGGVREQERQRVRPTLDDGLVDGVVLEALSGNAMHGDVGLGVA